MTAHWTCSVDRLPAAEQLTNFPFASAIQVLFSTILPAKVCSVKDTDWLCHTPPSTPPKYPPTPDVDECQLRTHTCPRNGFCRNTLGAFECLCNTGFQLIGGDCIGTSYGAENVTSYDTQPTSPIWLPMVTY